MIHPGRALFIFLLSFFQFAFAQDAPNRLKWNELPPLPDKIGFNGSFIGLQEDNLIVGGGANFPDAPVWEGGAKRWYDRIFVLKRNVKGEYEWLHDPSWKLLRPIGYGVALEGLGGLICMGGGNEEGVYRDVFLMKYVEDERQGHFEFETLPALPFPMVSMSGDKLGDQIYLAGGFDKNGGAATKRFVSLDLSKKGSKDFVWQVLEAWPGPARINPVVVAQNDGKTDKLFLMSGRNFDPDSPDPHTLHSDVYAYNPFAQTWKQLGDIPSNQTPGIEGGFIGAAPALAVGGSHILIFGGAGGERRHLLQRMTLGKEIDSLELVLQNGSSPTLLARLDSLQSLDSRLVQQTRFSRTIWAYHTITDTWVKAGEFTKPTQVVTRAVKSGDEILITGGEIGPGVRTTQTISGEIQSADAEFGVINYLTLFAYLAILVLMGWYFSRHNKTAADYLLGGQKLPWWAVGLSIYATQLSAITYLAVPALAYAFDWQTFLGMTGILLMAPIVIKYYLPHYRKLNITTAYEYLENRFDLKVRMLGAISFILFQLARMGVVVYLPALAISTMIGVNIYLSVAIMGALAIVYTFLGGIEAVIWTDVLQFFVLMGGVFLGLAYILNHIGDTAYIFETALADDKMRLLDLRWSSTEVVTWSLFLGSFALNIAPYTTDQTVVQRYMTTKSEKETAKGIWLNGILSLPGGFFIFLMGAFLYVFYKTNPELLQLGMENDQIFPLFIANQLPAGVAGLLVAGIFSATMSSLDSSMHSVSTVLTVDFYQRFSKGRQDRQSFSFARKMTVLVGVLGAGVAAYMALSPVQSLFFLFQEVLGLLGSALAGIFILGVFTKRVGATATLIGAVVSVLTVAYVKYYTGLNFYIYPLIGIPVCVLTGLFISWSRRHVVRSQ